MKPKLLYPTLEDYKRLPDEFLWDIIKDKDSKLEKERYELKEEYRKEFESVMRVLLVSKYEKTRTHLKRGKKGFWASAVYLNEYRFWIREKSIRIQLIIKFIELKDPDITLYNANISRENNNPFYKRDPLPIDNFSFCNILLRKLNNHYHRLSDLEKYETTFFPSFSFEDFVALLDNEIRPVNKKEDNLPNSAHAH